MERPAGTRSGDGVQPPLPDPEAGDSSARSPVQWAGLGAGAAVFLIMTLMGPPGGFGAAAWSVAALGALMVCWWVTTAIPIPVTSLLPLVVLPLSGVLSLRDAAAVYMSPIVVLLMAGFILAKGIERWGLHERIALAIIGAIGTRPIALLAGFMVSAALLSMWISNTATALMMTPIALSVAAALLGPDARNARFTTALLLSVAYACSIGGLGTPVGTPTNLIVIGYLADQGVVLSFSDWMRFGLPTVAVVLPVAWLILAHYGTAGIGAVPSGAAAREMIVTARARLGPITVPERRTLMVFAVIALSWILRPQLQKLPGLEALNDQIIGIAGVIAFFILPAGGAAQKGRALLDWESAERIPWGVVLLFGGGLSLATAISQSGLAEIMATMFLGLSAWPKVLILFALTCFVLALTEVTSNVATVSALMPMVGAIAAATGMDLLWLAVPVGLAGSCAFMLPMATGPNAVAYAAGGVPFARMALVGVRVNLAAALLITLIASLA